MHQIYISEKHNYTLPSRMDELTPAQLRKLMWVLSRPLKQIDKAKLIVLVQSLSLPFWKRLRFQFFYFFTSSLEEKADILLCAESFGKFDQFTGQKIEKIGGTFVQLYGPSAGLSNATFWEYVKAEKYFFNYVKTKDLDWLNKLVATLYRPKRKGYDRFTHDDIRIPLQDHALAYHIKIVEKTDLETKLAILKWFDSCRNALAKNFPMIFSSSKAQLNSSNPVEMLSQPSTGGGWIQLMSELSGSMDNYQKIAQTNLIIALTDISHRIKKSQELQAQARKKR